MTTTTIIRANILRLHPTLVQDMHEYADAVMTESKPPRAGVDFGHIVFRGSVPIVTTWLLGDECFLLKQYGEQYILVIATHL